LVRCVNHLHTVYDFGCVVTVVMIIVVMTMMPPTTMMPTSIYHAHFTANVIVTVL